MEGQKTLGVSKTGTSSVFQPEYVKLTTQKLIPLRNLENQKHVVITHTESSD